MQVLDGDGGLSAPWLTLAIIAPLPVIIPPIVPPSLQPIPTPVIPVCAAPTPVKLVVAVPPTGGACVASSGGSVFADPVLSAVAVDQPQPDDVIALIRSSRIVVTGEPETQPAPAPAAPPLLLFDDDSGEWQVAGDGTSDQATSLMLDDLGEEWVLLASPADAGVPNWQIATQSPLLA